MFLLIENNFSSDANDYFPTVLGYSHDQNILLKEAEKKRTEQKNSQEAYRKFHEETYPAWELENPAPEIKPYSVLEEPKWQSLPGQKQVITDEMRQERQAIRDKNEKAKLDAHKEYDAWYLKRLAFSNENCPPSEYDCEKTYWEVQSVCEIL